MADTQGQADIRGIEIDKIVGGYKYAGVVLKNYANVSKTSHREIRWYSRTGGFLSAPTTTGMTVNLAADVPAKVLPVVVENSYTRNTSYVKKYFLSSPMISIEDLDDCDPDVWGDLIIDTVKKVNYDIDARIYAVLSASGCLTAASTQDGWDDTATGNPFLDVSTAVQQIRVYYGQEMNAGLKPILYINSIENRNLLNWIVTVKGSSFPQVAGEKLTSGVVTKFAECDVIVSENATTDQALVFLDKFSVDWKEFIPLTSAVEDFPGRGKTVLVWAEGEAIRKHPYSVYKITDTVT